MADFDPDLPAVVPASGKTGARHADDRNALVAALELLNGGATEVSIRVADGQEALYRILDDADHARWTFGRNADGHFLIRRYNNDGSYAGTPVFIVRDSGFMYTEAVQVASPDTAVCPLIVKHASTTPTEAYLIVEDSTGAAKMRVKNDGTLEIVDGTSLNNAITKGQVKAIVAASTDFADFKTRMAEW